MVQAFAAAGALLAVWSAFMVWSIWREQRLRVEMKEGERRAMEGIFARRLSEARMLKDPVLEREILKMANSHGIDASDALERYHRGE